MAAQLPTRDLLGTFLNELGLIGHGVEVGAYRGDFSRKVLSKWKGAGWWLLDPWEVSPSFVLTNGTVAWDMPAALRSCQELEASDPRCRVVRIGGSRETNIPATLDCVYLDAAHDAKSTLAEMERWWPRISPGGILAGHDYLDTWDWGTDINRGTLFGVKTAVDYFARQSGRSVYATSEPWPSWWIRKPTSDAHSIAVVSASTPEVPWREITKANHSRYCEANAYQYYHETLVCNERPASWDKIGAVRGALQAADFAMWIDADAIFQRFDIRLESFWDGTASFLWHSDSRIGLNCGVFFARNCPETFAFLDRWEEMSDDPRFRHHVWWEQAAALDLLARNELPGVFLPLRAANSYPHCAKDGEWSATDFVSHPAGMIPSVRKAMLADLDFRARLTQR